MTGEGLNPTRRRQLGELADLLIPDDGSALSASRADVQGTGIDRVVRIRPDLLDAVLGLLDDVADDTPATFEALYAMRSPHFGGFAEAVTAAYYLNPTVAAGVGYGRRSAIPIVFDPDLDELVRTVVARGPIFRPTPTSSLPSAERTA